MCTGGHVPLPALGPEHQHSGAHVQRKANATAHHITAREPRGRSSQLRGQSPPPYLGLYSRPVSHNLCSGRYSRLRLDSGHAPTVIPWTVLTYLIVESNMIQIAL